MRQAEELHSPVIIGPAESLFARRFACGICRHDAGHGPPAGVPVALHFDHGFTPELVEEAIRLGFSSVMYDCSMLPFEENVRRPREIEMTPPRRTPRAAHWKQRSVMSFQRLRRRSRRQNHLYPAAGRAALCCRKRLRRAGCCHWYGPRRIRKSPCLIWTASPVLREHAQRRWCCMGAAGFRTTISAPVLREASPKSTFSLTIT